MFQRWSGLTFLHFSCPPGEIRQLIPPGLDLDTFPDAEGVESAWVGLVLLQMEDVQFVGLPKIPTATTFAETNVRTYVHRQGEDPGVWFFSLDARSLLATMGARLSYSLPYWYSDLKIDGFHYQGLRHLSHAIYNGIVSPDHDLQLASPGSLDFFLTERYRLYAKRGKRLFYGDVFHEPYPLASATCVIDESLIDAAGIKKRPFTHCCYSPGVAVDVYGLQPVKSH